MTGTIDEVTAMAEPFNQKTYAVNVFPIGIGERKVEISTDVPVVMPTMKIGKNGGYVMRFFNPELDDKTFMLTVNGNSQKIKMAKAEVVSVIYEDSKFTVCHDIMAI